MDRKYTILLVDDEPAIRGMISVFLEEEEQYKVLTADCGQAALEILKTESVDLVLSDVNMPGMKGFELLKIVKEQYPHIKRLLITAYNVEDYLGLTLSHDVGNIFVKSVPFNFQELSKLLKNLIEGNIFGVERYFAEGIKVHRNLIRKSTNLDIESQKIVIMIDDDTRGKQLELVLFELLTNAIFYGIRDENPENKQSWDFDFELSEETAVEVAVAIDDEKYAVSVKDRGGKLKKQNVLYWLHRQIAQDDKGMPLGLLDTHGRGLFIARRYIDRLIVNIDPGRQTEIILINYLNKTYSGSKPIYINEL
ncbi:MAG: response regulator [Chitinispirillia bacterium]|nr:response regulator [Chitinispirillia bacterium]